MTKLYHATIEELEIGKTIVATKPIKIYPNVIQLLDANKPIGAPSRSIAVFASDDAEFCVMYLLSQHHNLQESSINLYEVDMTTFWKSPFALTHAMYRNFTHGNIDRLTAEYWNPQTNWNYYEYFGPEMTIVRKLPSLNLSENLPHYTNLKLIYEGDTIKHKKILAS